MSRQATATIRACSIKRMITLKANFRRAARSLLESRTVLAPDAHGTIRIETTLAEILVRGEADQEADPAPRNQRARSPPAFKE
jgi:hypothetical protein